MVTIVDGGPALRRCLRALEAQIDPPSLEILIPYDDTVEIADAIDPTSPSIRLVPMGRVRTARPADGFTGQHELFDRRRTVGLRAAKGEFVAILEDRAAPRPDWAREAVAEIRSGWAAVGGAIENGVDRPLNRAVYLCDFGRYGLPFEARTTDRVSDVNVTYRRAALERIASIWADRYHEPEVNDALREAGGELCLCPRAVIDEVRGDLRLRPLVAERFYWARLYASHRCRRISTGRRIALVPGCLALPAVLWIRLARLHARRRWPIRGLLRITPTLVVLLVASAAGELSGYVTGRE